jgi:hypothetical protein
LNTVDAVVAADTVVDIVVDAADVGAVEDMADADIVVETADAVVAAARIDWHRYEPVIALSPFPKEICSCSPLNWKSSSGCLYLLLVLERWYLEPGAPGSAPKSQVLACPGSTRAP